MSTPIGYIKIEMLSLMAPLLVLLYAVSTGAAPWPARRTAHPGPVAGQPVSRSRVVLDKLLR